MDWPWILRDAAEEKARVNGRWRVSIRPMATMIASKMKQGVRWNEMRRKTKMKNENGVMSHHAAKNRWIGRCNDRGDEQTRGKTQERFSSERMKHLGRNEIL